MIIATLRRTYTFEAAHRLPLVCEGHKCGRMHGHSYRVTVIVRGPIDPVAGWVCDFAEIDAKMRPILATFDHATLNDFLPNPTSELLASWLLDHLLSVPHLSAVEVSETERSTCVMSVADRWNQ